MSQLSSFRSILRWKRSEARSGSWRLSVVDVGEIRVRFMSVRVDSVAQMGGWMLSWMASNWKNTHGSYFVKYYLKENQRIWLIEVAKASCHETMSSSERCWRDPMKVARGPVFISLWWCWCWWLSSLFLFWELLVFLARGEICPFRRRLEWVEAREQSKGH